ncbi:7119_t:CDS:2 [Acaulospora colombiana]|uniref:7119_t:CDS:1 n=1 Tax=Acaulospora colombiana TaxID=27376 RepID=A0ACA9KU50_9GLOM|nr:7119_t:CDS:2 [Acaulospora colombiana]
MLRKKLSRSGTLFASYLANMNVTDNTSSSGPGSITPQQLINLKGDALPDNLRVDILIKKIGAEYSWHNDQMKSDIAVLLRNRIYTVRDLRILSKESWKVIFYVIILMAVAETLVRVFKRDSVQTFRLTIVCVDDDFVDKRVGKKREKRDVLEIRRDMDNANNIIKEIRPVISENNSENEIIVKSIYKEEKLQMQQVRTSIEQTELFLPPPNKMAISGDRMKVKTSNGKIYEVDRLCPHAKSDLSTRGRSYSARNIVWHLILKIVENVLRSMKKSRLTPVPFMNGEVMFDSSSYGFPVNSRNENDYLNR